MASYKENNFPVMLNLYMQLLIIRRMKSNNRATRWKPYFIFLASQRALTANLNVIEKDHFLEFWVPPQISACISLFTVKD